MKRCWDEQELAEHWTVFESEVALFANRTERGRVGVAVLLKFFRFNARFPRHHKDVPGPVLERRGQFSHRCIAPRTMRPTVAK